MDRLSALIIGSLALVGCDKHDASDGDPPSRTNGAKVTKKAVSTEAFCDVHFTGDQGPAMQLPEVAGKEAIVGGRGWRWFNVWATWCKPCVEEMPRVLTWRDKLRAAGKSLEVSFISVDATDDDVTTFRKEHTQVPASARLIATKDQEGWFKQMGLDANAPIPIHVFVAPSGHIRCARAGSVREQDYAAIEALLAE